MNDPSPDLIKDAEIHQKLNENQLSYEELFQRVDKNHDGKIDVGELIELLENVGVETTTQNRAAIARVSFSEINHRDFLSLCSVLLDMGVDHRQILRCLFISSQIMF